MSSSLTKNDLNFGFGNFFIEANGKNADKITITMVVIGLILAFGLFIKLTK